MFALSDIEQISIEYIMNNMELISWEAFEEVIMQGPIK